jgi:hypothetical protein
VTIDFSLRLSTDYNVQELRRALEPVRLPDRTGWARRTSDSLTAFYLRNTSSIHTALLAESDSLFLSAGQVAALKKAEAAFGDSVRAIYGPLGAYLATLGEAGAGKAALDTVTAHRKAYWKVFWAQPEIAGEILTSTQLELFPMLKNMMQVPKKERENSQWQFGSPVKFKAPEKPKTTM